MTAVGWAARGRLADPLETPSLDRHVPRFALPGPSEGAVIAGISLGIYLVVAALLVFVMRSIEGDAWSRVGNAYYMLYSRDPHLAAIGFVWNPLPSLAVIPLLPFKELWPPLVEQGFAANIVSALCMAGAVYQLRAILLDLRVPRFTTLALTLLFALHPMVVFFAANGMSEAMFMLFTLAAVRHLVSWVAREESAALVHAGIALALLYLTRYEAVAVAAGAILFVLVYAFRRAHGGWRQRGGAAVADALIATTPFAFALGMFALTSWLIVGSPFETFSSVYGNTSQIGLGVEGIRDATGQGTAAATSYWVRQVTGLEPAVAIAGAAMVLAFARRKPQLLVPIVLLGAGLLFSVWTFTTGKTFGWLRFYILVVPLVTLAAGALLARLGRPSPGNAWAHRSANAVVTLAALALVALGFPSGLTAMSDPKLGREETDQVRWFLGAPFGGSTVSRQAQQATALELANYLDGLDLKPGSVLIDVAIGFPVVLQSRQPQQFVITPDRDFPAAAADPIAFGIRYLIVVPPYGYQSVNAIERLHPGIYDTGAGIAEDAADFGTGDASWRLYRVIGVP
jgi:hypothetical protein